MKGRGSKIGSLLSLLIASSFTLSCGGSNYFAPMSVKTTDDAIFEDIKKLADAQSYDAALSRLGELTASFRASYEVTKVEAGVHAGKCGLNFFSYTSSLGGGSSAPFALFESGFRTITVDPDECQAAQDVIDANLGATAALRTASLGTQRANNVNLFMAVLGMAKIGAKLREIGDTNGDGTSDGGFDACAMSNADTVTIGTGFALLMDNFATIGTTLGTSTKNLIDGLNSTCTGMTPNPCTVTNSNNAAWANATVLKAFRSLTNSHDIGFQTCTTGAPSPFACCP